MAKEKNRTNTTLIETRYALNKVTKHINELETIVNKIYQTMFSVPEVKALLWCESVGWHTNMKEIERECEMTHNDTFKMLEKAWLHKILASEGLLPNDGDLK